MPCDGCGANEAPYALYYCEDCITPEPKHLEINKSEMLAKIYYEAWRQANIKYQTPTWESLSLERKALETQVTSNITVDDLKLIIGAGNLTVK